MWLMFKSMSFLGTSQTEFLDIPEPHCKQSFHTSVKEIFEYDFHHINRVARSFGAVEYVDYISAKD